MTGVSPGFSLCGGCWPDGFPRAGNRDRPCGLGRSGCLQADCSRFLSVPVVAGGFGLPGGWVLAGFGGLRPAAGRSQVTGMVNLPAGRFDPVAVGFDRTVVRFDPVEGRFDLASIRFDLPVIRFDPMVVQFDPVMVYFDLLVVLSNPTLGRFDLPGVRFASVVAGFDCPLT